MKVNKDNNLLNYLNSILLFGFLIIPLSMQATELNSFTDSLCNSDTVFNERPKIRFLFNAPYLRDLRNNAQIYVPVSAGSIESCQVEATNQASTVAVVRRVLNNGQFQLFIVSTTTGKITPILGGSKDQFTAPPEGRTGEGGGSPDGIKVTANVELKSIQSQILDGGFEKFKFVHEVIVNNKPYLHITNLNLCGFSSDVDPHEITFEENEYPNVKDNNCVEYDDSIRAIKIDDKYLFNSSLLDGENSLFRGGDASLFYSRELDNSTNSIAGFTFSKPIIKILEYKPAYTTINLTNVLCIEANTADLSKKLAEGQIKAQKSSSGVLFVAESGDFYALIGPYVGVNSAMTDLSKYPEVFKNSFSFTSRLVEKDDKPHAFGIGQCQAI